MAIHPHSPSLPPAGGENMAVGLALIRDGLDRLAAVDSTSVGDDVVVGVWEELERLSRSQSAVSAVLLAEIDKRGLHQADGHNSVRTMARYKAKLSRGEAARRDQSMRVYRDLPAVAAAWHAGQISDCHVALLGRVHGNTRIRGLMPDTEDWFIEQAAETDYQGFERRVREWERLVDQDGPEPRDHDSRDAKLVQNGFDLSWDLTGHWPSLEGASLNEIFEYYIHAEWLADWDKAKAEHGDQTSEADLARTPPQRRADALAQIFRDAAANPDGALPARFVHNIVWTAATFETMVRLVATKQPADNNEGDEGARDPGFDPDDYRCSTVDGVPVDATEAIVNALLNQVRRVIIDAPSTVIDLGRARNFTGSARDAVQLQATHCVWPGCSGVRQAQPMETEGIHRLPRPNHRKVANHPPRRHRNRTDLRRRSWRRPAGMVWHANTTDGGTGTHVVRRTVELGSLG